MSFRDIKRAARRHLHQTMRVPALYIGSVGATPVPIYVRVHTKFADSGQASDRDIGNAIRHEVAPKLLFMISELESAGIDWRKLPRTAVISVERGEAYRIDTTLPPDDITITAIVTPVGPRDAAGLPVPEHV